MDKPQHTSLTTPPSASVEVRSAATPAPNAVSNTAQAQVSTPLSSPDAATMHTHNSDVVSNSSISHHTSSPLAASAAGSEALTTRLSSHPEVEGVTDLDTITYWHPRYKTATDFMAEQDSNSGQAHPIYGEELLAALHYVHLNQALTAPNPQAARLASLSQASSSLTDVNLILQNAEALDINHSALQTAPAPHVVPSAATAHTSSGSTVSGKANLEQDKQHQKSHESSQPVPQMDFSAIHSFDPVSGAAVLRARDAILPNNTDSSLEVPDVNRHISGLIAADHKLKATPHLNEKEVMDYNYIHGGRKGMKINVEQQIAQRLQAVKDKMRSVEQTAASLAAATVDTFNPVSSATAYPENHGPLAPPTPLLTEAYSAGLAAAASDKFSMPLGQALTLQPEISFLEGLIRGMHNLEHSIHLLMAILGDGLMLHAIGNNYQRKMLWVNQSLCKIYGYSYNQLDKLTGTPQNPQIIHPNDIGRFFNTFINCAAKQQQKVAASKAAKEASQATAGGAYAAAQAAQAVDGAQETASGAETTISTAPTAVAAAAAATESAHVTDPDAKFILNDLAAHLQNLQMVDTEDNIAHTEYRVLNGKSKQYIWIDIRGVYIGQYQGMALFLCLLKEITAEKKTKDRMERWIRKSEMLSEACQELVFEYDYNTDVFERFGNYQDYVPALQRKQKDFLENLPIKDNIHPDDRHILSSVLRDTSLASENKRRTVKFRLCPLGGQEYLWHACSAIGYTEESTGHIKIIGKVYNIHSYESHIATLNLKNQHDPMTHLLNKTAMDQRSRQILLEHKQERHALLMIDIDNFKQVNDKYGHSFGDEVIHMVANCLKNTFRSSDLVARVGGDEFAVLLKHVSFEQSLALAELYLQILSTQCTQLSQPYQVTSSVGIAYFPDDAANFDDLYNAADNALYMVKRHNKGKVAQYNDCLVAQPTPVIPPEMVLNQEQERFAQTLQKLERKRLSDAFATPHGNEPPRSGNANRADRAGSADRAGDGESEQHNEPNTRSDCSPAAAPADTAATADAAPNNAADAASNSAADDTPHPSQEQ